MTEPEPRTQCRLKFFGKLRVGRSKHLFRAQYSRSKDTNLRELTSKQITLGRAFMHAAKYAQPCTARQTCANFPHVCHPQRCVTMCITQKPKTSIKTTHKRVPHQSAEDVHHEKRALNDDEQNGQEAPAELLELVSVVALLQAQHERDKTYKSRRRSTKTHNIKRASQSHVKGDGDTRSRLNE